ncbi:MULTISPECIES: urease accessory protein UreE [Vibrio]|jgi:urease accessory protein|uniref:urease accessory protein UreE n=1 Tax=Vibrio TaxID=662 RepID=UPI000315CD40|nr:MULTISPECIES: urease accessory protein UreE [Vibrio]ANP77383.1 urease accessory protein UreE [Vibrio crassostreae 9CS106]MDH6027141.1 urease accessory protein UreE [Vibrio splendidus]OCH52271.1 urease accessory protein UreE [Vibrio sp. ZF57]OED73231.1 urease accessory protein UreE [Vibrio crassostreae ZF-91]OEE90601.1 urease accessory protein UreE [Vibrio crassostreae 9ZC88]
MIELTQLNTQIQNAPDGYLSLPIDSRIKSRLKVMLDDGRNAGLFLPRGHILRGGEQLSSKCGLVVEVKAAPETVSTVYCEDLLLLTRVAYHLGNRHVPLQVEAGWVRYQHDHVLDEMVEGLGAKVTTEKQPFEPEGGAYGGRSGGHHHHH